LHIMNLTILGIRDGKFSLVYLSPEMLLDSDWNQILLKSDIYQQKVCAIVIDEVHLLHTW
jgi:superfamily II DNA helicase RecQ